MNKRKSFKISNKVSFVICSEVVLIPTFVNDCNTFLSTIFKLENFVILQCFTVLGLYLCCYKSVSLSLTLLFKNSVVKHFHKHKRQTSITFQRRKMLPHLVCVFESSPLIYRCFLSHKCIQHINVPWAMLSTTALGNFYC